MFGQTGSMTFPMTYDYDHDGFYSSKRPGWKGLSSLEKSLSVALALVSVLALGLMIAVIIVGVKLNEDDYKPVLKPTEATQYPPWITTIPTTTTPKVVTTRERPTTLFPPTTINMSTTTDDEVTSTTESFLENCESERCWNMETNLDRSENPCENFYQFACGGWESGHSASDDKPLADQFMEVQSNFRKAIKRLLEGENGSNTDSMEVAQEFYGTCLNTTNEKGNVEKIRLLIDEMMADFDNSTEYLVPILARIRQRLDGNYIFRLWVDVHWEDETRNAIYLGRPDFEDYEKLMLAENLTERVESYTEFAIDTWTNFFINDTDSKIEDTVKDILEFEKKLFNVTDENYSSDFPPKVLIVNSEMVATSEDYGELARFINLTFSGTESCGNESCPSVQDLDFIIHDVNYYSAIFSFLNETDVRTTLNYVKWKIILDLMTHSDEQYRVAHENAGLGKQGQIPRWEMCVDETLKYFGPPLMAEYIHDSIPEPEEFKQQVHEMTENLIESVVEMTQEVSWIRDNSTRELVLRNMEQVQIFAVYPLSLTNDNLTEILDSYMNVTLTKTSHLQNILALKEWLSNKGLGLAWKTSTESLLQKEIDVQSSTEPFYDSLTHSLYVPTAAFRLPFYDGEDNSSMAFNYGSMGMLISRQIVEALLESGVEYHNGFAKSTWDEGTLTDFRNATDCVQTIYDGYNTSTMEPNAMNGERVMNMNMNTLDVGGFKAALKGYWMAKALLTNESYVSGFNPDQQFFIGFAQTWCASYTEENLLQQVRNGMQTSPVPVRVNAILESSEEFRQAWECPSTNSSKMDDCELW